jgi:hypothetical protein
LCGGCQLVVITIVGNFREQAFCLFRISKLVLYDAELIAGTKIGCIDLLGFQQNLTGSSIIT